jgi:hypothetical protein
MPFHISDSRASPEFRDKKIGHLNGGRFGCFRDLDIAPLSRSRY